LEAIWTWGKEEKDRQEIVSFSLLRNQQVSRRYAGHVLRQKMDPAWIRKLVQKMITTCIQQMKDTLLGI
jgi:hypothetical protein